MLANLNDQLSAWIRRLLHRNIRKTLRNFAVAVNVSFDPKHEA